MNYTIRNEELTVVASDAGGELQSVQKNGVEYLWSGDQTYWREKAPNLFPYIGRLTDGKYTLEGQTYEMLIHGFIKRRVLTLEEQSESHLVFRLDADEETLKEYPFRFTYRILYELDGSTLRVTYQVDNTDQKTIYFGAGAHPGFRLPLEAGVTFEDYCLDFETGGKDLYCHQVLFSDTVHVLGDTPYTVKGGSIPLRHDLFDHDAVVLCDTTSHVLLHAAGGSSAVRVNFPDMPYVGFWHAVKKPAPYVCIEPWSSLPSREGIIEDLSSQPDLIHLAAGETYRNQWSIELI